MVQTVKASASVNMEGGAFPPLEPVDVQQVSSEHAATSVSPSSAVLRLVTELAVHVAWDDRLCVSGVTACPAGRYGVDCARVALCGDGAQSDPLTGRCKCIPGRRGKDCGHGQFC